MDKTNKTKPAQGATSATKKKSATKKGFVRVAALRAFDTEMREAFAKNTGRVEIYLPGGSRGEGPLREVARLLAWYHAELNTAE